MSVLSIVIAILVLGLLVLVHEVGHYLVGRAFHFGIQEFAIGMGPKIKSWQRGETTFSLRLLPIGGFVNYLGDDEHSDDARAFHNKPVWQRFLAILGGAVMNILLAIVLSIILLLSFGDYYLPQVTKVSPDTPAQAAGLMEGDLITAVNGQPIERSSEMQLIVQDKQLQPVALTIDRNGETIELSVTPYHDTEHDRYLFGIECSNRKFYPFFQSVAKGFENTFLNVSDMLGFLKNLIFQGQGAGDVGGAVMIVTVLSSAANHSLEMVLMLMVLISINLGVINLLPLPALDGGRLLFLLIEAIRRKPLNREWEGRIHFIGLVAMFLLFIVLTYKDIMNLITGFPT